MVRDSLRDLCNRRLKVWHHEYSVATAFLDEWSDQLHHRILPQMAMEVGLSIGVRKAKPYVVQFSKSDEEDHADICDLL